MIHLKIWLNVIGIGLMAIGGALYAKVNSYIASHSLAPKALAAAQAYKHEFLIILIVGAILFVGTLFIKTGKSAAKKNFSSGSDDDNLF